MTDKTIAHTDLDKLLDRLRETGTVYVPARDEAGNVAFTEASCADSVALEYRNSRMSPKAFFLPQNQTLLCFQDGEVAEPAPPDPGPALLFGVRPCDAKALLALDEVFLGDDQDDPYYAQLRDKTVVIAMACTQPMSSCFCTSVGGGPGDPAGADVLAIPLETDLLLRAQTPKGQEVLASVDDLLVDATGDTVRQADDLVSAAEDQIASVKLDGCAEHLRDAYESEVWETIGRKCLSCGTCSFLCPTCHCFDITDEVRGGTGRRVRTWDCCAYSLFTLHASGHNPRPSPMQRWRQRIMHKFRYAVENHDRLFCVGCGRCIRECPVSIDLRTVLKQVGA